ncbi:MAG: hypothetical protein R2711_11185 [Acidimicrobiales bacterium]
MGRAAVEVIERVGWRAVVPERPVCCGLTWTGQLATGQRVLGRTVRTLAPHLRRGGLVLGLEPSCTAVFRSDARELLERSEDVERLRQQTVTLAELLRDRTPGWEPPSVPGGAIVQPHCHHHAIMRFEGDHELLDEVFEGDVDARGLLRPGRSLRLRGRPPRRVDGLRRARPARRWRCATPTKDGAARRRFSCRTQATPGHARHLGSFTSPRSWPTPSADRGRNDCDDRLGCVLRCSTAAPIRTFRACTTRAVS